MAITYSEQLTKLNNIPREVIPVNESHGKVRIQRFDYTQIAVDAVGAIVKLVKLPAGRITLLGKESALYHNLTIGTVTLDIGWEAYTDLDGDDIDADADGLDDGISCETAGVVRLGTVRAADCYAKTFESQEGVVIIATLMTVGIAVGDDLAGYIAYVAD